MGRHSAEQADSRWIGLLEHMNGKQATDPEYGVAVPVAFLLKEKWWTTPARSHAKPSASSRLLSRVWSFLSLSLGDLAEATTHSRRTFLNPRPWWARRRKSAQRPHDRALVIARRRIIGRASDDSRHLKRRLQRDVATRAGEPPFCWLGAASRHAIVLMLLVSLVRPSSEQVIHQDPPALARPWHGPNR
jgi:hypothetical protein